MNRLSCRTSSRSQAWISCVLSGFPFSNLRSRPWTFRSCLECRTNEHPTWLRAILGTQWSVSIGAWRALDCSTSPFDIRPFQVHSSIYQTQLTSLNARLRNSCQLLFLRSHRALCPPEGPAKRKSRASFCWPSHLLFLFGTFSLVLPFRCVLYGPYERATSRCRQECHANRTSLPCTQRTLKPRLFQPCSLPIASPFASSSLLRAIPGILSPTFSHLAMWRTGRAWF